MTKKDNTPATPTEHIAPGELSNRLATGLKERGKAITDAQITTAIGQVEQARQDFQVQAILTGIMLLAKKSSLKHGEWSVYLEKVFSKTGARSCFDISQYRRYMLLAKRFLWKVETNGFLDEAVDSDQLNLNATAVQVMDLALSDATDESLQPLFDKLSDFVAGRSLRRMLADFRQAEKDAEDEERREAVGSGDGPPSPPTEGPEDTGPTEPPAKRSVQLMLWEQFQTRKLPVLDSIFDEPGTEDLIGEDAILHYSQIADALEERAKKARALAEAAKEGKAKS